jgi:hypothetical protein
VHLVRERNGVSSRWINEAGGAGCVTCKQPSFEAKLGVSSGHIVKLQPQLFNSTTTSPHRAALLLLLLFLLRC